MPPGPELLRCRSLLDCRYHHQEVDLYPNLQKNHFYTMYNPASYTVCEDHFPMQHVELFNYESFTLKTVENLF